MSLALENVPFSEYLKMNENEAFLYTYSFRHGQFLNKAVNHFAIQPIRSFTFGMVKDAQVEYESGVQIADIPKLFEPFSDKPKKWYYQQGVVEVFQQFAWFRKEMDEILEVERMTLVRKLTDKELRAGVERFEQFGVYPQLKAYANAFNQTIEWARQQPYNDAFLELCYQKEAGEYERDLMAIKD